MSNNKVFIILLINLFLTSCASKTKDFSKEEIEINHLLNSFNLAATEADYPGYFNLLADDAVFVGTDATENWDKKSFKAFAKPYFDRGQVWDFQSIDRHIYFDETGNVAWFDELLNTQMKICRGSGVLTRQDGKWKIQQYVLSMTIPNSLTDTVVKLKSPEETELIQKIKQKQ